MAQPTPRLGLKKPFIGEEEWGTPLRESLDTIDALVETVEGAQQKVNVHAATVHSTMTTTVHDLHDHTGVPGVGAGGTAGVWRARERNTVQVIPETANSSSDAEARLDLVDIPSEEWPLDPNVTWDPVEKQLVVAQSGLYLVQLQVVWEPVSGQDIWAGLQWMGGAVVAIDGYDSVDYDPIYQGSSEIPEPELVARRTLMVGGGQRAHLWALDPGTPRVPPLTVTYATLSFLRLA